MTAGDGYELDMSSPVSHVATQMEGAGPDGPAPTVEAMAATYQHAVAGDLARIRRHEGAQSDHEATLWLVRAALGELGRQIKPDGDGYRLAKPFGKLRWHGRPVRRAGRDEHARLGDPFNPMTGGVFAANVRIGKAHKAKPPEDDILRESMRENGWLPGHPAVVDERGVVVTGHRRLKVARELGIEPQLERMTFGSGDEADIGRLKLAWWSNEGAKSYTPSDRQAVEVYLRERGWTQASIAEALHVAQSTISEDLRKAEQASLIIGPDNQNVQNGRVGPDSGSGGRRRGAGRPRGVGQTADRRRGPRQQQRAVTSEAEEQIIERVAEGASVKEIAKEFGIGEMSARDAKQRAWGRLAERAASQSGALHDAEADRNPEADAAAEAIEHFIAGYQLLAPAAQRSLVARLLQEMSTEDRGAVLGMIGELAR